MERETSLVICSFCPVLCNMASKNIIFNWARGGGGCNSLSYGDTVQSSGDVIQPLHDKRCIPSIFFKSLERLFSSYGEREGG